MTRRAVIEGAGHYLPDRVVPNSYFESFLNTSDEWIRARSGIERRHFASSSQTTSDLAFYAAKEAIQNARLNVDDIDGIVVATSTPDLTFPSVATMVQAKLEMKTGFGFDVQAVCAGFIFAVANANALIVSGQAERLLVVGSETFSRIMDWNDRSTCVLFGDGAGAIILAADEGAGTSDDRGILSTDINSDGSLKDLLYVDGGVSTSGTSGKLRMQGNLIFRQAVEKLTATTKQCLKKAGLKEREIDWMVPHQANLRIINAVANKMGISMDKIVLTIQDHGNTSAASIPLALSKGIREGKLKCGDLIVSEAIGGGL
ncbi:MAG: ketoacyl-ACP synthase III, partial [Roseovarius sp.]|nr:ketoacyl-ACP synthase III [Roseovarius sp.]